MLEGSVSLTEEAAPEASQYHLHEQIGEGSCEWLPPERALPYSTTPLARSTDLISHCAPFSWDCLSSDSGGGWMHTARH